MTELQGETPDLSTTPSTDGEMPGGAEKAPWGDDFTPERAWETIGKLRQLERKLTKELETTKRAEEERKRAEMTELERIKADLEAERQARTQAEERQRQQLLRTQVISAAAKLGFADPQDAILMLDQSALDADEAGNINGLDAALQALAKAKPYLIKSTTGTISPTNPAGGPQRTTQEQLRQEMFGPKNTKLFEGGGVFWSQE